MTGKKGITRNEQIDSNLFQSFCSRKSTQNTIRMSNIRNLNEITTVENVESFFFQPQIHNYTAKWTFS